MTIDEIIANYESPLRPVGNKSAAEQRMDEEDYRLAKEGKKHPSAPRSFIEVLALGLEVKA